MFANEELKFFSPDGGVIPVIDLTEDAVYRKAQEAVEKKPEFILESLILSINERIAFELERRKLSYTEFAKRLGVKQPYISKIMNGKPNLTLKSLSEIAAVLDLKFHEDIFLQFNDEEEDMKGNWVRMHALEGRKKYDPKLSLKAG